MHRKGKGKDKEDKEKKKLEDNIEQAIVSKKPNVKWSDVAGLDEAKK